MRMRASSCVDELGGLLTSFNVLVFKIFSMFELNTRVVF